MKRRSHKKSRNGCLECKKRHIKCDENRPSCYNCITVRRTCEFQDSPDADGSSPTTSPAASTYDFSAFAPPPSTASPIEDSEVNMIHLELLHQFRRQSIHFWGTEPQMGETYYNIVVTQALSVPFLMYEILAFTSHTLSVCQPQVVPSSSQHSPEFHHLLSMSLQTRALSLLNALTPLQLEEDSNRVGLFIFASVIGMHKLSETLQYRPSLSDGRGLSDDGGSAFEFQLMMVRFLEYFRLRAGVRAVALGKWATLQQSDLKPLLESGGKLMSVKGTGDECCDLKMLLREGITRDDGWVCLKGQELDACLHAIDLIQWAIDSFKAGKYQDALSMTLSWIPLVSDKVARLMEERRPEAIIILAYYALVLHMCRRLWTIGDSGARWIRLIAAVMGDRWEKWLRLPMSVIDKDNVVEGVEM